MKDEPVTMDEGWKADEIEVGLFRYVKFTNKQTGETRIICEYGGLIVVGVIIFLIVMIMAG